jgi:hypothetical protein
MPQANKVNERTEEPPETEEAVDPELLSSLHVLLMRLVGRVPDGAVSAGREALFGGRLDDLARLLGLVVFHGREPISPDEEELIRGLLMEFECDAVVLTPEVVGALNPAAQEVTVGEFVGDDAVLSAVEASDDAVGLWACWSGPAFGSPWPSRVRCYVVEASSGEGALRLDRRMHEDLAVGRRVGEPGSRFFVIGPDGAFTPDGAVVLESAELIWARAPAEEIQMAPVFAEVDAEGRPIGAEGDPLSEQDREAVLSYLLSAEVILQASEPGRDILDEESGAEVPLDLRSDGLWVWSDASAYYLSQHDVRPPQGLLDRASDAGGTAAAMDSVTYHRVLEALAGPMDTPPEPPSPAGSGASDSPEDGPAKAVRSPATKAASRAAAKKEAAPRATRTVAKKAASIRARAKKRT